MQVKIAPLSYQERVAQEKRRIAQEMLSSSAETHAQWEKRRVTRRLKLDSSGVLVVWNVSSLKPEYAISLQGVQFHPGSGLKASVAKITPDTGVVLELKEIQFNPVHFGKGCFVAIDGADALGFSEDRGSLNILTFSQAGVDGEWEEGFAIGTEQEFLSRK